MTGRVSDEELLRVFQSKENPVLTTREISKEIGLGERQTRNRLDQLEKNRQITRKEVGNETFIWIRRSALVNWQDTGFQVGVSVVDNLSVPGSGEKLKRRRKAINAVFRYLFFSADMDDYHIQNSYTEPETLKRVARVASPQIDYETTQSFWNNCIQKALSDAVFFEKNSSDQTYRLHKIGLNIIDRGGVHALWNNWERTKTEYLDYLSEASEQQFRDIIEDIDNTEIERKNKENNYVVRLTDIDSDVVIGRNYPDAVWVGGFPELFVSIKQAEDYSIKRGNFSGDILSGEIDPTDEYDELVIKTELDRRCLERLKTSLTEENKDWITDTVEEIRSSFDPK